MVCHLNNLNRQKTDVKSKTTKNIGQQSVSLIESKGVEASPQPTRTTHHGSPQKVSPWVQYIPLPGPSGWWFSLKEVIGQTLVSSFKRLSYSQCVCLMLSGWTANFYVTSNPRLCLKFTSLHISTSLSLSKGYLVANHSREVHSKSSEATHPVLNRVIINFVILSIYQPKVATSEYPLMYVLHCFK